MDRVCNVVPNFLHSLSGEGRQFCSRNYVFGGEYFLSFCLHLRRRKCSAAVRRGERVSWNLKNSNLNKNISQSIK
ncbi:unnamed protein product [Nesidiocoris tenuis]|uniref:Uncharacterized protein n=1 Tax=Nesidiocoris tenuis TaxID=355587 RepID=A0A6H5HCU6_9HEMI|nr:unnamed protein product [Nesidiocoris tenuis]